MTNKRMSLATDPLAVFVWSREVEQTGQVSLE